MEQIQIRKVAEKKRAEHEGKYTHGILREKKKILQRSKYSTDEKIYTLASF
jgi:hypothetical protein